MGGACLCANQTQAPSHAVPATVNLQICYKCEAINFVILFLTIVGECRNGVCAGHFIPTLGDCYLRVLMFDISVDLHKSAKFNTCKNYIVNKPS